MYYWIEGDRLSMAEWCDGPELYIIEVEHADPKLF